LVFACGTRQEQPQATTLQPAPTLGGVATEASAAAPQVATTTTLPQPAETPQPAGPAAPAAAPSAPAPKITLPAKLGAVVFDHEKHAGKQGIACTTCHHPSRPEKPLVSENQRCRDCHTMPAAPPMKTSLQGAFHDPRAAAGTCVDCHRRKGGKAPVKCLECHKKK
jgi:Class III cytochrome C family